MDRFMTTSLQARVGVRSAVRTVDEVDDARPDGLLLFLTVLAYNQEVEVSLTKAEVEQLVAWLMHPTIPLTIG